MNDRSIRPDEFHPQSLLALRCVAISAGIAYGHGIPIIVNVDARHTGRVERRRTHLGYAPMIFVDE